MQSLKFDTIILAGGQGSRMGFKDKGLLEFNGKKLIEFVSKLAHSVSQKVIISCNQNFDFYKNYGEIVKDEIDNFQGPLAGISSGLKKTTSEYAIILAVDSPNIDTSVIQNLVENMDKKTDICVAFDGENIHPTIMLLRTNLKNNLDEFLKSGERKLGFWIRQNKFKKVLIDEKLLININYPNDL
jgi:molybdopterin-guanine dinucleotide biosynthesis protein A